MAILLFYSLETCDYSQNTLFHGYLHNGLGQGGFVWEPPNFKLDPKCFQALIDMWIKYFWLNRPIGAQWGAVLKLRTSKYDLRFTQKWKILYIENFFFWYFLFKILSYVRYYFESQQYIGFSDVYITGLIIIF